jgi:hypothetical protein
MLVRRTWLVVVAGLAAAAGCVGGQSGTESGGGAKVIPDWTANIASAPGTCACSLSELPAVGVRATVVRVERDAIRLRVRTVLGEGPTEPLLRFAPGDEIGGAWAEPGCEPVASVQPGDDVAALHVPGSQIGYECPERRACVTARCDQLRTGDPRLASCDSDCQRETKAQCSTHAAEALLHGRVLIARWGAELALPVARGGARAGELRVDADELLQLLDVESCQKRVDRALPPEEFPDAGLGLGLAGDGDSTLGTAAVD